MYRRRPGMIKVKLCLCSSTVLARHRCILRDRVMHSALWHHSKLQLLASTATARPKLRQAARFAQIPKRADDLKSRCQGCRLSRQVNHQALAPAGRAPSRSHYAGPRKAGRGQVRLLRHWLGPSQQFTLCSFPIGLQLCIRCCEPHSYHERPHTYVQNPPTPGLRLALSNETGGKGAQGQQPDHPKALDAL